MVFLVWQNCNNNVLNSQGSDVYFTLDVTQKTSKLFSSPMSRGINGCKKLVINVWKDIFTPFVLGKMNILTLFHYLKYIFRFEFITYSLFSFYGWVFICWSLSENKESTWQRDRERSREERGPRLLQPGNILGFICVQVCN